ncbi:hypothetical protein E4K10_40475 [Streptomyces sp. T1317-0309]|nr:hypothetical protein E4K10_40475 [Streptomyces sp. T1317-0309]
MWEAAVVSQTMEIADDEAHRRYLHGILPAYFADYRRTVERVVNAPFGSPMTRTGTRSVGMYGPARHDRRAGAGDRRTYDFICPLGLRTRWTRGWRTRGCASSMKAAISGMSRRPTSSTLP